MRNGIGWDYESPGYYHIYASDDPLDGILEPIHIELPDTPENTASVEAIVKILEEMADRILADEK